MTKNTNAQRFADSLFVYFGVINLVFMVHFYSFILDNTKFIPWSIIFPYVFFVLAFHCLPAVIVSAAVTAFDRLGEGAAQKAHKAAISVFLILFSFWAASHAGLHFKLWLALSIALSTVLSAVVFYFYNYVVEFFKTVGYLTVLYLLYFFLQLGAFKQEQPYTIYNTPHGGEKADESKPNPTTIVIVYDDFSLLAILDGRGEISDEFPALKAVANESIWLKNAAMNYDATLYALPSMMTGKYIKSDDRSLFLEGENFRNAPNLFNIAASKYRVIVSEVWVRFCNGKPEFECHDENEFYLKHPIYFANILFTWFLKRSKFLPDPLKSRVPTLEAFVPFIKNADKIFLEFAGRKDIDGTLFYYHSLSPHGPHLLDRYGEPLGKKRETMSGFELYEEQIRYVDYILGRAVELLKKNGNWDKINLIVTSDHGDSWEPDMSGRAGDYINEKIARVTFFIKQANLKKGSVNENYYQHINFLPTVLEVMNLKAPGGLEGYSVLSEDKELPYFVQASGGWFYKDSQWWKTDSLGDEWVEIENILDYLPD